MTCSFPGPYQESRAANQARYQCYNNDELDQRLSTAICKLNYRLFDTIVHYLARFVYRLTNQTFVSFNQSLIHIYTGNSNTAQYRTISHSVDLILVFYPSQIIR